MSMRTHVQRARRVRWVGHNRPALLFHRLIYSRLLWGGLLLLICLGWFSLVAVRPGLAQSPQPAPTFDLEQIPTPAEPPAARRGRSIYSENCAPCHGPEGMGDGPTAAELPSPPTAFADADVVWDRSPAQLFHTTKFGNLESLMPPWQNQLSDQEIWQVVAYAWGLHTDSAFVTAGGERYASSCSECHGPTGAGDGPEAEGELPDFSNLRYAISDSQAEWQAGWQEAHPDIGADWSEDEQRQVLEYIRTFSYIPPWVSDYRPGDGVIRGSVVLGTDDAPDLSGAEVMLQAYLEFEPTATFTSTIQPDGTFEFADLSLDPELVYLATVTTEEMQYSSPIIRLDTETPTATTEITVYGTTDEPGNIFIDRAHWIIDLRPGALLVGQLLTFGSDNDRTYVGSTVEGVDDPVTVGVYVPREAEQVSLENGEIGGRFRRAGNFIYDTAPLVPGSATKQLVLRYALPYPETSAELNQEFLYPLNQVNLLVADLPQLQASISTLEDGGVEEFQGRSYRIWQGADVTAGIIVAQLNGLLPPGAADPRGDASATGVTGTTGTTGTSAAGSSSTTFAPWMGWTSGALVVLVLMGVITWAWRSGRLDTGSQQVDLAEQRDDLLQRIAQLDDLYAQGELDQQAWQTERALLKTRLLELAGRMDEAPPG